MIEFVCFSFSFYLSIYLYTHTQKILCVCVRACVYEREIVDEEVVYACVVPEGSPYYNWIALVIYFVMVIIGNYYVRDKFN